MRRLDSLLLQPQINLVDNSFLFSNRLSFADRLVLYLCPSRLSSQLFVINELYSILTTYSALLRSLSKMANETKHLPDHFITSLVLHIPSIKDRLRMALVCKHWRVFSSQWPDIKAVRLVHYGQPDVLIGVSVSISPYYCGPCAPFDSEWTSEFNFLLGWTVDSMNIMRRKIANLFGKSLLARIMRFSSNRTILSCALSDDFALQIRISVPLLQSTGKREFADGLLRCYRLRKVF
jgi:hypothetical protein